LTWFEHGAEYDHDSLYLDAFDTQYRVADLSDITELFPLGRVGRYLSNKYYNAIPEYTQKYMNYYKERALSTEDKQATAPVRFTYSPQVYNVNGNGYYVGYWQASQYLDNVAKILHNELTVQCSPNKQNRETIERIESTQSVSIHVRRGDYEEYGWTLSEQYYREAVRRIAEQYDSPQFFVFSDDIPWIQNNLNLGVGVHYVDHNDIATCYEDLRLMTRCEHNIIANSTFSWWGAWLNENNNKSVLCPPTWIDHRTEALDILPSSWEVVGAIV
jgi:hypothetical protein